MMAPEVVIAFAVMLFAMGVLAAEMWHDRTKGRCQTRIRELEVELELAGRIVDAAAPARVADPPGR